MSRKSLESQLLSDPGGLQAIMHPWSDLGQCAWLSWGTGPCSSDAVGPPQRVGFKVAEVLLLWALTSGE